jgi:hypothetical protein
MRRAGNSRDGKRLLGQFVDAHAGVPFNVFLHRDIRRSVTFDVEPPFASDVDYE